MASSGIGFEMEIRNLFDEVQEEKLTEVDVMQCSDKNKISACGQVQFRGSEATTMQILNEFRKNGDSGFCDVTLEVDGGDLSAHRNILAANSRFFFALFNSGMNDSTKERLKLNNLKYSAMNTIVEYFYTRTITVNTENITELLEASNFLMVKPVQIACEQALGKSLKKEKCFGVQRLAIKFDCSDLLKKTTTFIDKSFHAIIDGDCTSEFLNLSFEELAYIVSRDEIAVVREQNVFFAVLKWVRYDAGNRKDQLPELISLLRVRSIPKDFLKEQLDKEPLLQEAQSSNLVKQLIEGDNYSKLSHRPSVIVKKVIVGVSCKSAFVYDKDSNEARKLPMAMTQPSGIPRSPVLVSSGNTIFTIVGTIMRGLTFDHKEHIHFSSLDCPTSVIIQRIFYGVSALNGCVYAIGGIWQHFVYNTVGKFDPDIGVWEAVASLNRSRYELAAVSTERNIFAIGGRATVGFVNDEVVATVERYDPIQDEWSLVTPMPTKRANAFAAYNYGKIYCVGGENEVLESLSNCHVYDVCTDEWISITHLPRPHNHTINITSVVTTDNTIAVMSHSVLGDFDSVVYNMSTKSWEKHKLIKTPKGTDRYILCNMELQAFYLEDLPIIKFISDGDGDDDDDDDDDSEDDEENSDSFDDIYEEYDEESEHNEDD